MSTAESMREMLLVLRAFIGARELGYGGCIIESDGSDMCLPPMNGLLNDDCGYC